MTGPDISGVKDAEAPQTIESISKEDSVPHLEHGLGIDPALERRVRRKIDLVLMPLVMSLCEHSHISGMVEIGDDVWIQASTISD